MLLNPLAARALLIDPHVTPCRAQAQPARKENLVHSLPALVGVRNNKRLVVVIVLSRLNALPDGEEEVEVRVVCRSCCRTVRHLIGRCPVV